jgi:hypothetical protein
LVTGELPGFAATVVTVPTAVTRRREVLDRRRFLVALVAGVATACGVGRSEPDQSAPPTDDPEPPSPLDQEEPEPPEPDPPEPDPAPEGPPPAPEPAPPYEVSANETHPNAKAAGAAVVQALLTYEPDESLDTIVARATDQLGDADDVDAAAEIFHEGAWSRGEVVYPQFGGLTDDRCSIMAVARQTVGLPDGEELVELRTLDVRLRVVQGHWTFERLASAGGVPVARPDDLDDDAVAVLDDERIELPDSARWDIHRGAIVPALLRAMTRMAEVSGGYAVNVLDTGHPTNVFGTDRVSDHTRGRAVDIHQIGDRLVIDDREPGSLTQQVVEQLYENPKEPVLGSPWALDGFGGRSFTDPVHQDHLHLAIPRPADEDDVPDEELAS